MCEAMGTSFDDSTYLAYQNNELPGDGTMDAPLGRDSELEPIPDGAILKLFDKKDTQTFCELH